MNADAPRPRFITQAVESFPKRRPPPNRYPLRLRRSVHPALPGLLLALLAIGSFGHHDSAFGQSPTSASGAASQTPAGAMESQAPAPRVTQLGPVTVTTELDRATVPIGDSIAFRITAVAEPGVEVFMPDFGQSLGRFSILEFVPRESVGSDGKTRYQQRYTLQTESSGRYTIPPILVEFVDRRDGRALAPEGVDAYEIVTDQVPFEVTSVTATAAGADLLPPRGELAPLTRPGESASPWIALAIVGGAVLAAVFAWLRRRNRQRPTRSAYEIASERLAALRAAPRPEITHHHDRSTAGVSPPATPPGSPEISEADRTAVDNFFVTLSDIVRRYLEDQFRLHAPELTTEEFLEIASTSPDLSAEHHHFLRGFLRHADQVKFARLLPDPESIESALDTVARFLEETRNRHAEGDVHA